MDTREIALLANEDGTPKTLDLQIRESRTPSRMKVTFTATVEDGTAIRMPDGEVKDMTQALPKGVEGMFALCDEFRLEMS